MLSSQRGFLTIGEQSARGMNNSSQLPKSTFGLALDLSQARKEKNAQLEQEEEDAFLREDTSKWDVFKDAHKFERRDQILEQRKKQRVNQELKDIRSHREIQEENTEADELKKQIVRLQEKITYKDRIIDGKIAREKEMLEERKKLDQQMEVKDQEIH